MTADIASKFYYTKGSVYAYVVALLLHEKHIENDFEFVPVKLGEDNIKPWYIKLNPKGQVPTLIHKNKSIPDSFDIAVYLDEAFPDITYSTQDPEVIAIVENWRQFRILALLAGRKTPTQDIGQAQEGLNQLKEQALVYAKENPDIDYQTRLDAHDARAPSLIDHEVYLAQKKRAEVLFNETDAQLEGRDTVLSKGRTLADIYVLAFVYWISQKLGPEFLEKYKNLNRFYQKETAKDSFCAFKSKF